MGSRQNGWYRLSPISVPFPKIRKRVAASWLGVLRQRIMAVVWRALTINYPIVPGEIPCLRPRVAVGSGEAAAATDLGHVAVGR